MDTKQVFYITALIIAFVFMIMLIRKGFRRKKNRILMLLNIDIIVCTGALLIGSFFDSNLIMQYTVMYIYHSIHVLFPLLFAIFTVELVGKWYDIGKIKLLILTLPVVIFYIVLILNPFSNYFSFSFTLDEVTGEYIYHRGNGILIEYVAAAIYIAFAFYYIVKYRLALGKEKFVDIIIYVLFVLIGVIVQLVLPSVKLELFMSSLGLIMIGGNVENQNQLIDKKSNCFNFDTFVMDVDQYSRAKFTFRVILVKIADYNSRVVYDGINATTELIKTIAELLKSFIKRNDMVYYVNSGVFAFVTFNTSDLKVSSIYDIMRTKLDNSLDIDIIPLLSPNDAKSANDFVAVIDRIPSNPGITLLNSKSLGFIKRNTDVEKAIKNALDNNTLMVYYQPIFDTKKNNFHSCEALARINDPFLGFIPPDEFIKIAEKTGMIKELGERILEIVCKDIEKGELIKLGIEFIEVNLSPIQCMLPNLHNRFDNILKEHNIKPNQINLEITESTAYKDKNDFKATYDNLKSFGFKFSLDDYGTGVSNISSIYEMDFTIVKIDKSILWNSNKNEGYKKILESNVNMLHNLNFSIVFEGVETEEQLNYLKEQGVEYIQGYYFSKPIPYDELIVFLKEHNI